MHEPNSKFNRQQLTKNTKNQPDIASIHHTGNYPHTTCCANDSPIAYFFVNFRRLFNDSVWALTKPPTNFKNSRIGFSLLQTHLKINQIAPEYPVTSGNYVYACSARISNIQLGGCPRMESLLRKTHFAPISRSFSTNSDGYPPQMIEKYALKWIPLATTSILGQPPGKHP